MRLIQLNVENPNGTLLQVDTEKIRLIELGAVKFVVDISVIRNRKSLVIFLSLVRLLMGNSN